LSDIEEWLRAFLAEWRRQYKTLPEEARSEMQTINNFLPPCQMLFIDFREYNFQHLIVTRHDERPDCKISVFGPVPLHEAVDMFGSILEDPKWDRRLTEGEEESWPGEPKSFREVLEGHFLGLYHRLRSAPFWKKPTSTFVGACMVLTEDSFIWYIRGDLTELDPAEEARKLVESARRRPEVARPPQGEPSSPTRRSIRGYGAYFYPPVWIGEPPERSFREKAFGAYSPAKKVFHTEYKGRVLVVNSNGYIVIGEEDKRKAIRMLNEIFAACLLSDLPFVAVRDMDVAEAGINAADMTLGSWGSGDSPLRDLLFQQEHGLLRGPFLTVLPERQTMDEKEVDRLIESAEEWTGDPEVADFLVLLLESHTCLENYENRQSFLMSWMIIERHIFWLWMRTLEEEQIARKRRSKLTNPTYMTTDLMLEVLNIAGRLSAEQYSTLMELKNRRNDVIHKGKNISRDEAEKAFQNARSFVQQRTEALS